jgi:hypothetical protein
MGKVPDTITQKSKGAYAAALCPAQYGAKRAVTAVSV